MLNFKESQWTDGYKQLVEPNERQDAQAGFELAMTDSLFKQWWEKVQGIYDHATPTFPTCSKAFIVYFNPVELSDAQTAALNLGWQHVGQVCGRHIYENSASTVKMVLADRQAFIVGVKKK